MRAPLPNAGFLAHTHPIMLCILLLIKNNSYLHASIIVTAINVHAYLDKEGYSYLVSHVAHCAFANVLEWADTTYVNVPFAGN